MENLQPETLHRDGSGGVNEKEVGELLLNFGIDLPDEELAVLTRRCPLPFISKNLQFIYLVQGNLLHITIFTSNVQVDILIETKFIDYKYLHMNMSCSSISGSTYLEKSWLSSPGGALSLSYRLTYNIYT